MTDKEELRKKIIRMRSMQGRDLAADRSARIARTLLKMREYLSAENIFCYVSLDKEVDTSEIISNSIAEGKKVYVPFIEGENMFFCKINSTDDLSRGNLGFHEPRCTKERQTSSSNQDIIIIPGVCFDRTGNRIGLGRGFYDKALSKGYRRGLRIGLAFGFQVLPDIPVTDHDEKVDLVITEDSIISRKEARG